MRGRLTGAGIRSLRAIPARVCLVAWLAGTSTPAQQTSSPSEVVAGGFKDPVGVVVNGDGSIVVSDRKADTVTRAAPDGTVYVSAKQMVPVAKGRASIASDNDDGGSGRILALGPSGSLTTLASGFHGLEGLPFVYDRPGIYVPTLRATTTDGQVLTYRTAVEVYDRAALDARLQALWNGFTEALQSGDVVRAVGFIHGNRRAAWQDYFDQLLPDELAAEGGQFTKIELMQVGRRGAEYEMLREEDRRVFSYPIALVVDVDGRWRLWQF